MTRKEAAQVNLAGTVTAKKERTSAKGNRYAFVGLSDSSGAYEVTVFSETLAAAREFLEVGQSVLIRATVQPDEGGVRFLANEFRALEAAAAHTVQHMRICITSDEAVLAIRDILAAEKTGHGRIRIHAQPTDCRWEADLELDQAFTLSPDTHLALRNLPDVIRVEPFEIQ